MIWFDLPDLILNTVHVISWVSVTVKRSNLSKIQEFIFDPLLLTNQTCSSTKLDTQRGINRRRSSSDSRGLFIIIYIWLGYILKLTWCILTIKAFIKCIKRNNKHRSVYTQWLGSDSEDIFCFNKRHHLISHLISSFKVWGDKAWTFKDTFMIKIRHDNNLQKYKTPVCSLFSSVTVWRCC